MMQTIAPTVVEGTPNDAPNDKANHRANDASSSASPDVLHPAAAALPLPAVERVQAWHRNRLTRVSASAAPAPRPADDTRRAKPARAAREAPKGR